MKRPSFQFYPGDWMKDPALSMCRTSTRGIWMDMICAIHETGTGEITGTVEQLARLCRCPVEEMSAAIDDLRDTSASRVTVRDKKVTLVCKRMEREAKERQSHAERQLKYRERKTVTASDGQSDKKVTPYSSSSSSSSSSDKTPCLPQKAHSGIETTATVTQPLRNRYETPANGNGAHEPPGFARFWDAWPNHHRKTGRKQCLSKWNSGKLEVQADRIVQAVELAKRSHDWTKDGGQYIPLPMTWLNRGQWDAVITANQPRMFVEDN